MTLAPQVGHYSTRLGSEQVLTFNASSNLQIVIIEGLFEERNFLRKSVIDMARLLAAQGVGIVVPDLPGCGESLLDIGDVTLRDWQCAITDVTEMVFAESGRRPHISSFRGGALIDHAAKGASFWRFAPAGGAELLRSFRQVQRLRDPADNDGLAGHAVRSDMIADLERAAPQPPPGPYRECATRSAGSPLWRRAEPGDDPALVQILADDLTHWVETCAVA
jgi:hypothetical protein